MQNPEEGRKIGINLVVASKALNLLLNGPAPNRENMRGAILMDLSGNRLEPDQYRGVRVSRMDYTPKKWF